MDGKCNRRRQRLRIRDEERHGGGGGGSERPLPIGNKQSLFTWVIMVSSLLSIFSRWTSCDADTALISVSLSTNSYNKTATDMSAK